MAGGKFNIDDDDLRGLLEQLGDIEDFDIDLGDSSALEEASDFSEDDLDALLENHEVENSNPLKALNDGGFFAGDDDDKEDDDRADPIKEISSSDNENDASVENETAQIFEDAEILGKDIVSGEQGLPTLDEEIMDVGALSALLGDGDVVRENSTDADVSGQADEDSINGDDIFDEMDYFSELNSDQWGDSWDGEDLKTEDWHDDLLGDVLETSMGGEAQEDDILLPDFSFNESFTTRGKDGSVVASSSASRGSRKTPEEEFDDLFDELDGGSAKEEREKKNYLKEFIDKLRGMIPESVHEKISPLQNKLKKINKLKKKRLSQKTKLIVTAVVMFIALLISSIALFRQYRIMKGLIEEDRVIVRESAQSLNYASSIHTENKKTLNDAELTLRRISLDNYMSMFHFNSHIDMERCFAELRDDIGNYYGKYMPLSGELARNADDIESSTLWFEGVKDGAEFLTLTIWDSYTKQSAEFEVDISDYTLPGAKYMQDARGARSEYTGVSVTIEESVFSSTMSSVTYKLEQKGNARIVQEANSLKPPAAIENSGRSTLTLLKQPLLYEAGNSLVGRMDFNPIRSLQSAVRMTLEGLYLEFEINQVVSAAPLFADDHDSEMRFDFGEGTLVLERMRGGGGLYVLVYHLENKEGERIDGVVDAGMILETYTGVRIELEPYTHSRTEGGDMLFEYDSPNSVIDNSSPENVYIDLRSVKLEIPGVTTELQVERFASDASEQNNSEVKAFIKNAYMQRLAIKSGAGDKNALSSYFDNEVLEDMSLNKLYEPQAVTNDPEYAVVVNTVAQLSRFEYLAIVDESWLGINGEDRTHIYNTHQIIVKQNGYNFVIISDELEDVD